MPQETKIDKRHEALEAIQDYITHINSVSKSGEIIEHVCHLMFDNCNYRAYEYRSACVGILAVMAHPIHHEEIKGALGNWYSDLVLMLDKLHDFFDSMSIENQEAEVLHCWIENYSDLSDEHYRGITQDYKTKIKGLRNYSR